MKILVTAFEPFGGETVNATGALLSALPETAAGAALLGETLPVVFTQAARELRALLDRHTPDAVLCLGQYGGSPALSLERVAINIAHGGADNAGDAPHHRPVVPGGPDAYFAKLPLDDILEAARQAGTPMILSNTAGTYVCNTVMYTLLDAMAGGASPKLGGFLHVPSTPAQALGRSLPSMETSTALRGVLAALTVMAGRLQ